MEHMANCFFLCKDTTEPKIELICLQNAAWTTAPMYMKGPMTAAT